MTIVRPRTWVIVLSVATLSVVGGFLYGDREGSFSYANYERIQTGMSHERVAELLGSSGEQTKNIRGFNTGAGVVWGDTFVHWRAGDDDIYVGFAEGRVTSKYYWEPSL